ncbi:MAG: hypothetical protein NVSMB56_01800 [Pyrinomonadaceae bacterium]
MASWQHRHLNNTITAFITDEYGDFQLSILEDSLDGGFPSVKIKKSLDKAKQSADRMVQIYHPHDCAVSECSEWNEFAEPQQAAIADVDLTELEKDMLPEFQTVEPTCPKCDSQEFNLRDYDPPDNDFNIEVLCCSKCGAVIGTIGYKISQKRISDIYILIARIAKEMKIVQ